MEAACDYIIDNPLKIFIGSNVLLFISSILMTRKSSDELGFCVDYWKLNEMTYKDQYSISSDEWADDSSKQNQDNLDFNSSVFDEIRSPIDANRLGVHGSSDSGTLAISHTWDGLGAAPHWSIDRIHCTSDSFCFAPIYGCWDVVSALNGKRQSGALSETHQNLLLYSNPDLHWENWSNSLSPSVQCLRDWLLMLSLSRGWRSQAHSCSLCMILEGLSFTEGLWVGGS